jgi:hypothetical protein
VINSTIPGISPEKESAPKGIFTKQMANYPIYRLSWTLEGFSRPRVAAWAPNPL